MEEFENARKRAEEEEKEREKLATDFINGDGDFDWEMYEWNFLGSLWEAEND